jgi:hypothetical protein
VEYFVFFYHLHGIRRVHNLYSVSSIICNRVYACMEENTINVKRDQNSSKIGIKMSLSLAC